MKKRLIVLACILVMLASAALAEDLSSLSDADLMELYDRVQEEIAQRCLLVDEAVSTRLGDFLVCWSENDPDRMLELCSSEWKDTADDPMQALLQILSDRLPLSIEITDLNGDPTDTLRTLKATMEIDSQDGTAHGNMVFHIDMIREEDGNWYVDPRGLEAGEPAEDFSREDPVPDVAEFPGVTPDPDTDTENMVLYYVQEGGTYYHLDPNCPCVNEKYLPMQSSFRYEELEDEPFCDLNPCLVCGAPCRPE